MAESILIVAEDVARLQALGGAFEGAGWTVFRELSLEDALPACLRALPDVVLVDHSSVDGHYAEAVSRISDTGAVVVALVASDQQSNTGAQQFVGFDTVARDAGSREELILVARNGAETAKLRRVHGSLSRVGSNPAALEWLGGSEAAMELREHLTSLATGDLPAVLVLGEPGTGKASVARLIHDLSSRVNGAFLEATPSSDDTGQLAERLFGVAGMIGEGLSGSRRGLLDSADGGTLLLRQVASSSVGVQAELEATLSRGGFRRLGGSREVATDLRLVCTSSIDLEEAMAAGLVNSELCYRLMAATIELPPLREFPSDDFSRAVHRVLPLLVPGLLDLPRAVSDAALERMMGHTWPGNFHELRQVLARALLLGRGRSEIGLEHLPAEFRARPGPFDRRHTPLTMEEVERMHIERTLRHHDGNRTRSAEELGISRATLISKIKKYAIPL